MNNSISKTIKNKKDKVLNIFFTAGYPELESTIPILKSLEKGGVDLVEIGIPYSDPLADGPVIQQSSRVALENGMHLELLFEQLQAARGEVSVPILLMGYFNPIFTYGVEKFLRKCSEVGIAGTIIPDLPLDYYIRNYRTAYQKYNLSHIFLISPETSEARIREIDRYSTGFIYAVSSSSTTGNSSGGVSGYLKELSTLALNTPVLTGFNIQDRESFREATAYTQGGIIGSAFLQRIAGLDEMELALEISRFIKEVQGVANNPLQPIKF